MRYTNNKCTHTQTAALYWIATIRRIVYQLKDQRRFFCVIVVASYQIDKIQLESYMDIRRLNSWDVIYLNALSVSSFTVEIFESTFLYSTDTLKFQTWCEIF